ncbi:MAG TPA: GNAT family N-acetyltransferase [Ktedonobacterales bacterium]
MAGMTIRQATRDDIAALLELYREFHVYHVRSVPDRLRVPERYDDEQTSEQLQPILDGDDAALFVAEDGGRLVGLAEVYLKRDDPHPAAIAYAHGYLQSLMVTEAMRGQGVGRRLVQAAHRWATEHGATEMRLSTWEHAAGPQAFYEGLGYRTLRRTLVFTIEGEL